MWTIIFTLLLPQIFGNPDPESSASIPSFLAPGPFGPLDNLNPPTPVTEKPSVFVPPDIRYWAFGKVNTTVYDKGGLPWFCYTYRQTHCRFVKCCPFLDILECGTLKMNLIWLQAPVQITSRVQDHKETLQK